MAKADVALPNTGGQVRITIEVVETSQDPGNNRTLVTWKGYLYNAQYNYYNNWNRPQDYIQVLLDGTQVAKKDKANWDFRSGPREQMVVTGQSYVTHGADGKKTLTAKTFYTDQSFGSGTAEVSLKLTDISRGQVTIGTPSGNRTGEVWIGTPAGNRQAKEVWIGTPSGNRQAK